MVAPLSATPAIQYVEAAPAGHGAFEELAAST